MYLTPALFKAWIAFAVARLPPGFPPAHAHAFEVIAPGDQLIDGRNNDRRSDKQDQQSKTQPAQGIGQPGSVIDGRNGNFLCIQYYHDRQNGIDRQLEEVLARLDHLAHRKNALEAGCRV